MSVIVAALYRLKLEHCVQPRMIVAAFYLLDITAAALYRLDILVVVLYRIGMIFAALYMDTDDNTLEHRTVQI